MPCTKNAPFFLDGVTLKPPDPTLRGDLRVQVCVVGGGLSGLSVALHLAELGISTAVLEAQSIGWGATGRSAGHLVTGYLSSPDEMAATLGSEHALDLLRLSNAAKEALKARIRSCAIQCEFRSGYVYVGLRPSHHAALRAMAEYWKLQLGMSDAHFLVGRELHAHVRSPLYQCGLFDPTAGTIDPFKLLTALARRLRDLGGLLFEGSPARRISDQSTNCIVVDTDDGSVLADHVVICTNASPQTLFVPAPPSIMPVACSVIATNPLGVSDIREILPTRISGSDWRMAPDYWTVTTDNRILFGNGGFHLSSLTTNNATTLARRLGQIFPALRGVTVNRCWHGTIAMTRSHLPDIGRRGRNVWVARGYNGVGLALAYYAGVLIADAITGRTEAIKTFERIPSRYFPTGYLRLPALLMHAMRLWLRDLV